MIHCHIWKQFSLLLVLLWSCGFQAVNANKELLLIKQTSKIFGGLVFHFATLNIRSFLRYISSTLNYTTGNCALPLLVPFPDLLLRSFPWLCCVPFIFFSPLIWMSCHIADINCFGYYNFLMKDHWSSARYQFDAAHSRISPDPF